MKREQNYNNPATTDSSTPDYVASEGQADAFDHDDAALSDLLSGSEDNVDHLSEDAGADFQISDEVGGGSDIGNEITDQVQDEDIRAADWLLTIWTQAADDDAAQHPDSQQHINTPSDGPAAQYSDASRDINAPDNAEADDRVNTADCQDGSVDNADGDQQNEDPREDASASKTNDDQVIPGNTSETTNDDSGFDNQQDDMAPADAQDTSQSNTTTDATTGQIKTMKTRLNPCLTKSIMRKRIRRSVPSHLLRRILHPKSRRQGWFRMSKDHRRSAETSVTSSMAATTRVI
ncbi:Protein of unknown function [Pyronema omphalodes CBS 100304]|uniref:Uncharacterized protein n=1 Tax=Pyronema omphalodes (strain CBS 100304) TaxID=1076935 RepID=U4L196_PYROM|nr:Protein of unknown function [Pyronema omphalodes CBS 100304]